MVTVYGQRTQQQRDDDARLLADALLRVPVLTRSQLARYASLSPVRVKRLLKRYDTLFAQRPYDGEIHCATGYGARRNGTQYLVGLTGYAHSHYGHRTLPRRTSPASVGRILATGDVLLACKEAGLIGHTWDIRVPHERHASVHAWITYADDALPCIGLFLLPHTGDIWTGKRSILRGYVDRTIQNVHVLHLLFLCPGKHYERALRQLATMEVGTRNLHLLPAESFLRNPAFYLDAIRTPDRALDWHILLQPPKRCLPVPIGYSGFRALIEDQAGVYKLLDWWNGGDIGKVQAWVEDYAARVYLIPDDPGKVASGWVYVADETMREALAKLLDVRGSLARVYAAGEAYR